VNIFETTWYKQINSILTPGEVMKVYRENHGLTTQELGDQLGYLTSEEISEIESNQRQINSDTAEKLSELFHVPKERFL
jgi:transcriptional regulator with XRE-family HTH domain